MTEGAVDVPRPRVRIRRPESPTTSSVTLGLPSRNLYSKELNLFSPPPRPHVFTADRFQLVTNNASRQLVDAQGVRVLYAHGTRSEGKWYFEDPDFKRKGMTVQDVVEEYERNTGDRIDALFVCDKNPSRVRVVPFAGSESNPKIVMRGKEASGRVMLDEQGKINVVMNADQEGDVEYQKWLAKKASTTPRQHLEQLATR